MSSGSARSGLATRTLCATSGATHSALVTSRRVRSRLAWLPLLGLWALAACGPEVGVAAPPPSATATGTGGPVTTAPTTTAPATTGATTGAPVKATPSPSASAAPRSFTVVGSGDVLLHGLLWTQGANDARALGQSGYDFVPL